MISQSLPQVMSNCHALTSYVRAVKSYPKMAPKIVKGNHNKISALPGFCSPSPKLKEKQHTSVSADIVKHIRPLKHDQTLLLKHLKFAMFNRCHKMFDRVQNIVLIFECFEQGILQLQIKVM